MTTLDRIMAHAHAKARDVEAEYETLAGGQTVDQWDADQTARDPEPEEQLPLTFASLMRRASALLEPHRTAAWEHIYRAIDDLDRLPELRDKLLNDCIGAIKTEEAKACQATAPT